MYEWLVFAVIFDIIWLVLYVLKPHLRRQMLWVGALTALTGLLEPIFVPRYWTPPSLFNLAATTHFDIESIIFSFGRGGIGSVLYEAALKMQHRKMMPAELRRERRWFHLLSLSVMPIVFGVLFFFTGLNPIYCVSAALFLGALAAVACRPDLAWNTALGGLLFVGLYFIVFFLVTQVYPDFVSSWNLAALSGILVLGVPLEELMYASAFGMLWSGVYEHIRHYSLIEVEGKVSDPLVT